MHNLCLAFMELEYAQKIRYMMYFLFQFPTVAFHIWLFKLDRYLIDMTTSIVFWCDASVLRCSFQNRFTKKIFFIFYGTWVSLQRKWGFSLIMCNCWHDYFFWCIDDMSHSDIEPSRSTENWQILILRTRKYDGKFSNSFAKKAEKLWLHFAQKSNKLWCDFFMQQTTKTIVLFFEGHEHIFPPVSYCH